MAKPHKAGKSNKSAAEHTSKANFWDVCIRFLDVVNDLFKTGNIFGAVLLLIFCYALYITHKLPPDNINSFILMLLRFLRAEKFYIFPGTFLLLVSLVANYIQHKYYTKEISRLVTVRSELVHGLNSGKLEPISTHVSSEFDIEDTDQ